MLIHLLPQLNQLHIVLASASPRRLALLQSLGLTSITVHPSTFPELLPHSSHTPSSYALATSLAKAQSTLSSLHPNSPPPDLLISADTVISLPPHIIEKPATPSHALSTLRRLSNTTHSVLTAVTLIRPRDGATLSFVEETRVTFTTLTDAAMQAYVDTGEPMDKAGGYGIQGMAAQFVRRIEGDYSNVVGLPLHALCARMEAFVQPLLAKAGGGGGGADGVAAVAALPAAVRGEGVEEERVAMLRGLVGSYPEWPVAGVLFRDIFPLFQSPTAAQTALDLFAEHITATHTTVDVIVGLGTPPTPILPHPPPTQTTHSPTPPSHPLAVSPPSPPVRGARLFVWCCHRSPSGCRLRAHTEGGEAAGSGAVRGV